MVQIKNDSASLRISQGDIYKDVEFIEYAIDKEGVLEISKVIFPLVLVLTQDCDLLQDYNSRFDPVDATANQDKFLLSVLVAPIYNAEHIYIGEHLSELGLKMSQVPRSGNTGEFLRKNQRPRYHYLEFPPNISITPSVIDFKHYFSVNVSYLKELKSKNYVCTISELYRESISQRFAYFLSRIGLPGVV